MQRARRLFTLAIVLAVFVAADQAGAAGKKTEKKAEVKPAAKAKVEAKVKGSGTAVAAAGGAGASSQPKNAVPDARATSLFRSAENLEKAGKKPGAIGMYRDLLIKYPESPEAPETARRLTALGGKLPDPSEINPAPPASEAKFTRVPKPKYASQAAQRAALNEAIGGAMSQPSATGGGGGGYGGRAPYAP